MAQRSGRRPSIANIMDWLGTHGRRIFNLEKAIEGNGKPGLKDDIKTLQKTVITIRLQQRWIIAIAAASVPSVITIGGWIILNQIDQGKAISALTAAMQTVLK